ncbi:hypothetical protein COC43_23135 [Bacillus thuringiensis]|uniref:HesA/MoeB/ThiF family protein n=1 Tax=Bacillus thuringiensis TaxID=1428 RepID=UPI000BFC5C1F|nr:ThiF family adenylyltransferase [Bacillus thuringiensis]PGR73105.1 hypothetical protein COC43_23135 [Bacillus thuringiensis]
MELEIKQNTRYKLKPRVQTTVKDNKLIFLSNGKRIDCEYWGESCFQCLKLWREGGTLADFENHLEINYPGAWKIFKSVFFELFADGFFHEMDIESELSDYEQNRWKRTIDFLADFEDKDSNCLAKFERLRQAHVLLVGTGGLGSWVLYQLLCIGIGEVTLIDGDKVSSDNLNRSILFNDEDVGNFKVDRAKKMANKFSPSTKINTVKSYINKADDLLKHLNQVDLVLSCADQPYWYIREYVTEACIKGNVPHLIHNGGKVGPFAIPGKTACPMCELNRLLDARPELRKQIEIQSTLPKGHSGGLSAAASMVAGAMAFEVFRYLTDYKKPETINHIWEFNGMSNVNIKPVVKYDKCETCATY